ncbi:TonB-dependent receptor [Aurantiacibacter gangjinensis]|uniref:Uncharacterized protein n=1 Tax=Aurantiacibacter gangjinensis TaxID=502682 RepID=A0A0G9MRS9_9SPHN|nr:TonB-dependent receptor [Aurantiacibacter gangjinensis]APE28107.1 TonB-dependent receptor [Aurantiacibacter gangjinensis]KLE32028.1 hypothetical protein AAW01_11420 [Aurantiacibacter gangjinensis]
MKTYLKTALLAATVMSSTTAFAQETGVTEESADDDRTGNQIIVTARKREETVQEVPTTVAVTTAETIEALGLDNLQDIARTTPGLIFDDSLGRDGNRPVIRGQANILGDSGVAYFIDGIYYTGSLADYDVDTIERIEVVKGPQSALYGRNTYSGAINIISRAPTDFWEGRVTADISENDRYELTAGLRGPVSDGLSLGINGRYFTNGGEFVNQFDGETVGQQESYSLSSILRWDNGGDFRAQLRGYYNRTDDGQPAIFSQPTTENNCIFDDGALYGGGGRYFCGVIEPGEINTDYTRQFANPEDVGIEADTYNVSLRMEYDLTPDLTLVSLSGYNDRTQTTLTDGDYGPNSFQTAVFARFPAGPPDFSSGRPVFPFAFVGTTVDFSFANRREVSDFSQELRLEYQGDLFDFILGGYYFDQSDDNFSIREVPADAAARAGASFGAAFANEQAICAANPICGSVVPFFGPSTPEDRSENLFDIRNIASFAALTIHVTPTFNIGLEGRYSEETIEEEIYDFDEGDPRPVPIVAQQVYRSFTPRVTLDWAVTPDHLLYGIYAEGQKPGGFNGALAIAAGVPTYDEENNTSWEIGSKNALFNDNVIFNIAGFYTDIEGYQLTQNISVPPNQVSTIVNAGDAEILGLEVETIARLGDNITLTANYALADSEFTSGFDENEGVLNDVRDNGLVDCSIGDEFPDVPDCQSLFGSIEGRRIPRAPVHRIFADAAFTMPLGASDWNLFAGGNVTYTSSSFAQVHNLAETGDSTVVDFRAGVENGRYRLHFYVDNAFDEDAVGQILRYADADNNFRRSFVAGLRPGRRFGVILSAGF